MVEVGSGNSTLIAAEAIRKNRAEDAAHACQHVCVEPYEMPWLEDRGVEVVRQRVESLDPSFFSLLEAGDILFIDSSHVIRPEGDVLYLVQSILPVLNKGVYVHVHDIFTPYHYPPRWLFEKVLFWNEQYVLESFLAMNSGFSVVAALYDLHRSAFDAFAEAFPPVRQPFRLPRPGFGFNASRRRSVSPVKETRVYPSCPVFHQDDAAQQKFGALLLVASERGRDKRFLH